MGGKETERMAEMAERLGAVLDGCGNMTIAVSGGVDSMTLAAFAHRRLGPDRARMAHALSPAVPAAATARVESHAHAEGWRLALVEAGEFADERYRANPLDRCFYCKSNLYGALAALAEGVVLSGTNCDDLGDYRPGLRAATEHAVRHPYVEAGFAKAEVRALARFLDLPELAALPASPCLASRVETGIRIEVPTLNLIEQVEAWLQRTLEPEAVRCRVRRHGTVIELDDETISGLAPERRVLLIEEVRRRLPGTAPGPVELASYRQGSAFVGDKAATGR
jgi:uncharacterized protein